MFRKYIFASVLLSNCVSLFGMTFYSPSPVDISDLPQSVQDEVYIYEQQKAKLMLLESQLEADSENDADSMYR